MEKWCVWALALAVGFIVNVAWAGGDYKASVSTGKNYQASSAKQQAAASKAPLNQLITKSGVREDRRAFQKPTVIILYPGSLKNNITRLAKQNGWYNVVWDIANDYRWVGKTEVVADNFPDALRKVLRDYPVQAVFYDGNRVLLIRSRTLR